MEGFNGMDHWGKHPEISAELGSYMAEGTLKNYETVVDGLDDAWRTVNMLFTGDNLGKLLVKVADD
jgi:NADPH-dependent curcumin reductase CurA